MRFGKSKPCSGEEEEDSPREREFGIVWETYTMEREREREREREEVIRIPLKGAYSLTISLKLERRDQISKGCKK